MMRIFELRARRGARLFTLRDAAYRRRHSVTPSRRWRRGRRVFAVRRVRDRSTQGGGIFFASAAILIAI